MPQPVHMFVTRLLLEQNHNTLTDGTNQLAHIYVTRQLLLNHSTQTDGMLQLALMSATKLLLSYHSTPTISFSQLAATIVCNHL